MRERHLGLRRISADGGSPGGWLLTGDRIDVAGHGIWQEILRRLQERPESACLKCGELTLSRRQVLDEVERLAALLPEGRIGLHMARSVSSVLLTLAIWRNGGCYTPIAPDYPPGRVQGIAESCGLDAVIADRDIELAGFNDIGAFGEAALRVHLRQGGSSSNGPLAEGVCYVAHTSGSTGEPKGVMVSHASLMTRIACMRRLLAIGPDDRILYKTSAVFDVHVWEFVLPLAAGCLLVIYPQGRMFDLPAVSRIMVADRITVAGFVPALLRLLLDNPGFLEGNWIRAMLCGGEAWGPELARDFYARMPGRQLYNSYGPAETTIAVANWAVPNFAVQERADLEVAICLGGPLPNSLFLVEDDDEGMGEEVTGKLHVGGAQVAIGYVGMPGRTAAGSERFFERDIDGERVRFYATGDHVRLNPSSGSLQFKGRQDHQVKVNGMRIELEEIEAAVRAVDLVEACAAILAKSGGSSQLCVAYTSRGDADIRASEIRQACLKRLPSMFVPTRLARVAALPLSEAGKVDRVRLRARFEAE